MYPRIIHRVFHSYWAIQPGMLDTILTLLHTRLAGISAVRAEEDLEPGLVEEEEMASEEIVQKTVILFAKGIVGKHLSALDMMCGGLSLDALSRRLEEAAADETVREIVLWLDTPGGVVTGTPETAALIRRIRAQGKTVVGYCDSLCASAGYWIMGACDGIYCTRSAMLGSIGVYSALYDYQGWMEKNGYKLELFKAGDYKAMGLPGTELTKQQRKLLQDEVDAIYGEFTSAVTGDRGEVTDFHEAVKIGKETMQGQTFRGHAAVAAGLADVVVDGLEDVLADLRANRMTA